MERDSMDFVTMIAKMIDHSLLHPALTDGELVEGCEIARKHHVASVCVKPYHVKQAKQLLAGSDVLVGAVVGFPHGNHTIEIKVAETEQVIRDGAAEVDMVINIGKALSEDWAFIEREISAVAAVTERAGAVLKVIFENDLLPSDAHKIKLCEICSAARVGFVKTSTGYNYLRDSDGKYYYRGATDHDLALMRRHSAPEVQVKAAGSVGTLDAILRVRDLGVTRVGTKGTETILRDAQQRAAGSN